MIVMKKLLMNIIQMEMEKFQFVFLVVIKKDSIIYYISGLVYELYIRPCTIKNNKMVMNMIKELETPSKNEIVLLIILIERYKKDKK